MKSRILAGLFIPVVCWAALRAATPNGDVPAISAVADDAKPFGLEGPTSGRYSAVTNCSSSNCHGSGSKGNEYATWAGDDPHHKAYAGLFNDVSVRIQKNLHRDTPAHLDSQCLKCHAVNEEKHYHGETIPGRGLSEGVSCDACHGASQAWLGEHFRDGWKQLTDREKFEKYGFKQTKDLVTRTLMCAACHVGARDREVNHDMIAAGHPRLAFEAARFHFTSNYPKHWKEKIAGPNFELNLMVVGQAASLRQVVDLLAARAERATTTTAPWPELSEYSCFACHQDVTGSKNRTKYGERISRLPGRAGWQLWYTSLVTPNPDEQKFARWLSLNKLMAKDVVDAALVADVARKAVAELDIALAEYQNRGKERLLPFFAARIAREATQHALTDDKKKLRDTDWDFLAQHTLALAAAAHASGDASKEWRPHVAALQAALGFPAGKPGERYDSPKDYDVKAVLEHFQAIDRILNRAGGER